jgi:hypothetical protein
MHKVHGMRGIPPINVWQDSTIVLAKALYFVNALPSKAHLPYTKKYQISFINQMPLFLANVIKNFNPKLRGTSK